MGGKKTERCGRCAMSTVVDATVGDEEAAESEATDDERRTAPDPYDGARIEVDEDELRAVSPSAWFGGVVSRLDDWATRLAYGGRN